MATVSILVQQGHRSGRGRRWYGWVKIVTAGHPDVAVEPWTYRMRKPRIVIDDRLALRGWQDQGPF